ncbi:MAG: V-type ATPase subunit [Clostridia bacterium]|nr:V-type ATPase subunit [Clostridia bacterium]
MNFSQNAIMAKSRALYGKRLKKEDYDSLINSKSVNEIVSYLKAETAYGETFQNANSDISTVQVEELLKIHILKSFEKVSRYEISAGEQFYKLTLMKNDIQQILRFLQLLMVDKPEEYLKVLPPFFNKHSELDLYKLASARSFDDLLTALQGTPYQKVLKPFEGTFKDPRSYMRMECALDEKLWEAEKNVVGKYKGKEKKHIKEIISYQNDMENLIRIYRLKRLANEEKATIRRFLNLNYTNFTDKDINSMLDADTAREVIQRASQTYYKKHFLNHSFDSLESFTRKILYDRFHKEIRYSTDPITVMISYFYLSENEVKNIIHIVEGVRYGMPPEAIGALPIGTDC